MLRKYATSFLTIGLALGLTNVLFAAQDTRYKEVTVTPHRQEYVTVQFTNDEMIVRGHQGTIPQEFASKRKSLTITAQSVSLSGKLIFDREGVHLGDSLFTYDRITDLQIADSADIVLIRLFTGPTATDPIARKRRGNRVTFSEPITVATGEFVRGMIFTVVGDVAVNGEVNKDVVSLFGSVQIGQTAVVRGDLATIGGYVEIERKASVYGNSYVGTDDQTFSTHRLNRGERHFGMTPNFVYNRVDGANPSIEARFTASDSSLPTVYASVGWAFESGRWRVKGGLEQTILREYGVTLGIEGHRDLLSDDDWLISDRENTVYALLVTEDFKDYYEATGGSIYIAARPALHTYAELGYRNDVTNWIRSHRDLWSLFGGDKRFSENFTTVPDAHRIEGMAQIDSGRIASIYAGVSFDNRSSDPFSASAWAFTLTGEVSDPDFNSDYDFSRFTASLRRYQKVSHHSILVARGMIGGSSGYLPIHRTFYLGGLGTVHGYRHKELRGSRFWMINTEYRHTIPRTDLALAILWDAAQIGYIRENWEDVEVRHSIGGAIYFGDDVRVSVARRLDGFSDRDPRIFVRLEHVF